MPRYLIKIIFLVKSFYACTLCRLVLLCENPCACLPVLNLHLENSSRQSEENDVEFFSNVVGCYKITTVFSHAQTVVLCVSCSTVLCQPTGGRARLTEGGNFLLFILAVRVHLSFKNSMNTWPIRII